MTYRTHVSLGLAVSCSTALIPIHSLNPFFYINSITELACIFALIFVSSLAPDFDEPESYLSKRFPWFIISRILSIFTTHRGVTHYFLAALVYSIIIGSLLFAYFKYEAINYLYILSFSFLAYFSHSLGDGATIGGVKRFWYPFSKKTFWSLPKFLRFKTGSIIENFYMLFFMAIFLLEMFFLFKQKLPILQFLNNFFL